VVRRLASKLRVSPDRAGFLSVSRAQLLKAQEQIMLPSPFFHLRDSQRRDPSFGITRFLPVHGDDVLPVPSLEAFASGAAHGIDLMIGTTSEEANIFFAPSGARDKISRFLAIFLTSRALPNARRALAAYGLNEAGARPGHVMTRAWTDLMFRAMARRTAELKGERTFVYEFDWRSPALGGQLGAAHAMELPFVFDTLACASGPRGLMGENPPQALADSIHALWVRFATDGTAPWPAFDGETRRVYSLTAQTAAHEPVMPAAAFLPQG
jgi:para-nitrobenzyl esterase